MRVKTGPRFLEKVMIKSFVFFNNLLGEERGLLLNVLEGVKIKKLQVAIWRYRKLSIFKKFIAHRQARLRSLPGKGKLSPKRSLQNCLWTINYIDHQIFHHERTPFGLKGLSVIAKEKLKEKEMFVVRSHFLPASNKEVKTGRNLLLVILGF